MKYIWCQKYNTEDKYQWEKVLESNDLWKLVQLVFKSNSNINRSGKTGSRFIQNKIESTATGRQFSQYMTKKQCDEV